MPSLKFLTTNLKYESILLDNSYTRIFSGSSSLFGAAGYYFYGAIIRFKKI